MSDIHRIPNNLLILVCDSRKAILLRNSDSALRPTLEVIERVESEHEAGRLDGSDRAGRRFDANNAEATFQSKSAMAQTDLKKKSAEEFSDSIILRLEKVFESEPRHQLLIAAPPAFLGVLRDRMPASILDNVVAEVPKHLTDAQLDEIASSLAKTGAAMH
jgi:protein required for attachment to host cells